MYEFDEYDFEIIVENYVKNNVDMKLFRKAVDNEKFDDCVKGISAGFIREFAPRKNWDVSREYVRLIVGKVLTFISGENIIVDHTSKGIGFINKLGEFKFAMNWNESQLRAFLGNTKHFASDLLELQPKEYLFLEVDGFIQIENKLYLNIEGHKPLIPRSKLWLNLTEYQQLMHYKIEQGDL